MVAITQIIAASAAIFGAVSASPAAKRGTGVVHRITAGSTTANNGLHFEPENVVAEIGDTIEFHFLPKNHSVVQSSFDKPCQPLAGGAGFFSGFNFKTDVGESDKVFTFQIQNKDPIWYYCSQTVGNHCQKGMSGVINQNFNQNDKTLVNYKKNAVNTTTIQPSADPLKSQGGTILPNTFRG